MAMTGVLRPGYCQLRVLDLEESINFYINQFGLVETGRDDEGRVYMKCHDERDHHSLIIREADTAGMDFYAFKVLDSNTLDRLETGVREFGLTTERIPAGDLMATGERIRFTAPTGHVFELYCDIEEVGDGLGNTNPEVIIPDRKGISPTRLDHWQLHGADLDGTRDLFIDVLGFSLVEKVVSTDGTLDLAIWLTCSTKAHDIAFVRDERSNTLHHTSFNLPTWEAVLHAADLVTYYNLNMDIGPLRHGITRGQTVYFFDPSGNRIENFTGGYDFYPDMKPTTWTEDEFGRAVFYHTRELNERFLTVVT